MRTEDCTHIQTFDLHSAILSVATSDMLKNVNLWKAVTASPSRKGYVVQELWYENKFCCPVCRRAGPLYVDLTVAAALACLPASVSRVAFTESGRFMAVEEHQVGQCLQKIYFQKKCISNQHTLGHIALTWLA